MVALLGVANAQEQNAVTLTIDAGYDGYYRENHWLPVQVHIRNAGEAITGRLTVRPQSSGRVVSNAYSTPVEVARNGEKSVTLYIQARSFPPRITVELLGEADERIAQAETGILVVEPYDRLHLVVADSLTGTPNLQTVASGGRRASQARFGVQQLPALPEALAQIDLIMLTNIDSEALTLTQIDALRQYVLRGGHLIVTGGTAWRSTVASLGDLLPFLPSRAETGITAEGLADFVGVDGANLNQETPVTRGELREGAQILAQTDADIPLLVRHRMGAGVVDFLTVDPTLEPLRSWEALPRLWLTMLITRPATVGWTKGLVDFNEGATAISILPNVELLPTVDSMLLYLAFYIVLVGPVNYWVLSRLNRRGLAWVTIPLLIIGFSALSWTVGFNLRGNDVILSRLTVVQSWQDEDDAFMTQLIGVLSPRRATYSLFDTSEDMRPLRVLPPLAQTGILAQNISQSSSDIVQDAVFSARDFAVDGGIFANFSIEGRVDAPAIGGRLTLTYEDEETQALRGVIRNDSDITLQDAVLLYRGGVYNFDAPIAPGDLITLNQGDIVITPTNAFASAAPFEYTYGLPSESLQSARDFLRAQANLRSAYHILGSAPTVRVRQILDEDPQAQERARREALLKAIVRDQFSSPARANDAYLVGWANEWARDVDVVGTGWRDVAMTLYIVRLDVSVDTSNTPERVAIHPDQFTWSGLYRENIEGAGVEDMILLQGAVGDFRFVPQTGSVLSEVDELIVTLDRMSSYGRDVVLYLWDWQAGEWRDFGAGTTQIYVIDEPSNFIGEGNVVDVRVTFDGRLGTVRVRGITVQQIGNF